ncbi:gp62 protein [Methylobacterium sp. GXF4]|nr:gp62 protein [Methylobacterium sp. GXF4]
MAHFIGTVQGARGEASRLGHKSSGITGYVASWSGGCRSTAYVSAAGVDCVLIELVPHQGSGTHQVIYDGPICGGVGMTDLERKCAVA